MLVSTHLTWHVQVYGFSNHAVSVFIPFLLLILIRCLWALLACLAPEHMPSQVCGLLHPGLVSRA